MAKIQKDTYNHKGWITSDKFFKRAFGIWGHFIVAHIIIILGSLFLVLLIILVFEIFKKFL